VAWGLRAWLDACTGKHVRYSTAVARALKERGHEVLLTTRHHPDTLELARLLGEDFLAVGRYVPGSCEGKLRASIERERLLLGLLAEEGFEPDVAICHQSVELCRVAFGLGVPVICTSDTPHAEAVGKLTIPLSDVLVASRAIPKSLFEGFGAHRIEQFDGVDEVAWISRPGLMAGEIPPEVAEATRPLIVVREEEHGASYMRGGGVMAKLAGELSELGSVIFLPRYGRPPSLPEDVITPSGFLDAALLAGEADLVVGAGGTLCREAALQGTPSIVVKLLGARIHVNDYLASKGFPIFEVEPGDVLKLAGELLGRRWDTSSLLRSLEDPVPLIVRLAEELSREP